jgi:hypothetical protein
MCLDDVPVFKNNKRTNQNLLKYFLIPYIKNVWVVIYLYRLRVENF